MEQIERIATAFHTYEAVVPAARTSEDHDAAVAAATARVDLVLSLCCCGYEPEPEVTAQVRRDIHLLCCEAGLTVG